MDHAQPSVDIPGPWTHRRVVVGNVTLHCVEAGAGPLVLLLHGFPEFWYSWRRQLPVLAAAGFHAVAPDQRGYNTSDKPPRVRDYRLGLLARDAARLIEAAGGVAAVVGHDWGGAVAWRLAMDRPDLVSRLVVLNAPHPIAFRRALRDPIQWLRSSYMLFFQLPVLPERLFAADNFAVLARTLRRQPASRDAFTPADVAHYQRAFARRGALTAALNWYRALVQYPDELRHPIRRIDAPTLLLWGECDPYLGVGMSEGLLSWVPRLRVERLPGVSHWVQNDAPERVNELLTAFLREEFP